MLGKLSKLKAGLAALSEQGFIHRDFHTNTARSAENKSPSGVGFGPPFGLDFGDNYLATDYGV